MEQIATTLHDEIINLFNQKIRKEFKGNQPEAIIVLTVLSFFENRKSTFKCPVGYGFASDVNGRKASFLLTL